MPVTVVKCSVPDCCKDAEYKIAAPWKGGRFSELKTYGYACAEHAEAVVASARQRSKVRHFSPEESVGEIAAHEIEPR
jgi:hypothetical protein